MPAFAIQSKQNQLKLKRELIFEMKNTDSAERAELAQRML